MTPATWPSCIGPGRLTAIHIPSKQEEAARDLLRCREDIRADLLRARHRLSKFLLRHGRRFTATKKAWSKRHEAWLRGQRWPLPAFDQTHRAYLRAVDETVARLRAVEEDLRALLTLQPLHERVQRLRCFRGIDDLTALTIAAELGDAPLRQCAAHHGLRRPDSVGAIGRLSKGESSTVLCDTDARLELALLERGSSDESWSCGSDPRISE